MDTTFKLDELARAAGTSPRTVRYYVQRGLLPGPTFRGKDSAYSHEHLVRLKAIRRLQDAFFPLDAIVVELGRRTLEEIERIADGRELPAVGDPKQNLGQIPAGPPSSSCPLKAAHELQPAGQLEAADELKPAGSKARLFRRIEIAPGIELSVAEDAPVASQEIAEKILQSVGKA